MQTSPCLVDVNNFIGNNRLSFQQAKTPQGKLIRDPDPSLLVFAGNQSPSSDYASNPRDSNTHHLFLRAKQDDYWTKIVKYNTQMHNLEQIELKEKKKTAQLRMRQMLAE